MVHIVIIIINIHSLFTVIFFKKKQFLGGKYLNTFSLFILARNFNVQKSEAMLRKVKKKMFFLLMTLLLLKAT